MISFDDFNTNLIIAILRSLTHEIDRAYKRLYEDDIDDEESEELGLYRQDLMTSRSLIIEEYERRQGDLQDELSGVDLLLENFSKENFLKK